MPPPIARRPPRILRYKPYRWLGYLPPRIKPTPKQVALAMQFKSWAGYDAYVGRDRGGVKGKEKGDNICKTCTGDAA